jgi:hypothetical protein
MPMNLQGLKTILFTIAFLLFLPNSWAGRNAEQASIRWSETPLSWKDFKGIPDSKHGGALTASGFYYNFKCENGVAEWEVGAVFFPEKSYVNPQVRHPYMLAHEQLHFDITELFARKLRKQLSEGNIGCEDQAEVEYLCERMVEEWRAFQQQYDIETRHSMERDAQVFWNSMIRDALKELEVWKD